jgi:ATP-dependent Clp protease ATP-binding subunit ClpB
MEVTDSAKDFLAQVGYDPAFGARPLRRAIQEHVLEPLSEKIIAGKVQPGQKFIVDRSGNSIVVSNMTRAA